MNIIDREFFDGYYLTTDPTIIDGSKCLHVEPPLFPPVEYEGKTVYVVRAWRSKQLLDDNPHLPIETCDVSLTAADKLIDIWINIGNGDLSKFSPSAQRLISYDLSNGLAPEEITNLRGGILGDFIGFTIEEARAFKPELFVLIDVEVDTSESGL